MPQCTAKSKRTKQRCQQPAMHGSNVCYMHGGKTPKGIALPQTTHGRYSKYLPARLLPNYAAAQDDTELLELRSEIALLDTRIADLLTRVDSGEAGAQWKTLRTSWNKLDISIKTADSKAMLTALQDMDAVIGRGLSDYQAWDELTRLLDQRRKLVESERKRLIDMQQTITSEQALLLVSALLDSIRRNVTDRQALSAIQTDFILLTQRQDSQRISAGGDTD